VSERVLTITPERLSGLMRIGEGVVLVDVRSPAEYRAGHVPGATLLPLDELDVDRVVAKTGTTEIGADRTLYLTCHSGARAREAAERLHAAGRRNLAVVEGGTEAWARAGLPLRRCGAALTLQRQAQIAVGLLIVLKVISGYTVHELFFAAAALLVAGLVAAGVTRWCGMERLMGLMPWNRAGKCPDDLPSTSG
jgi:rhodanese-related sulfurtransferase